MYAACVKGSYYSMVSLNMDHNCYILNSIFCKHFVVILGKRFKGDYLLLICIQCFFLTLHQNASDKTFVVTIIIIAINDYFRNSFLDGFVSSFSVQLNQWQISFKNIITDNMYQVSKSMRLNLLRSISRTNLCFKFKCNSLLHLVSPLLITNIFDHNLCENTL